MDKLLQEKLFWVKQGKEEEELDRLENEYRDSETYIERGEVDAIEKGER